MSETKKEESMNTSSSYVNGTEGILIYRGYDIRDLGLNATFEEVVYLLWNSTPRRGDRSAHPRSPAPLPASPAGSARSG